MEDTPLTLHVGDKMPNVNLIDHNLHPWRISDQAGRPLVLVMHRHLA